MPNIQQNNYRTYILYELKRIFVTALQDSDFSKNIIKSIENELKYYNKNIQSIFINENNIIEIEIIENETNDLDKHISSSQIIHQVIADYCFISINDSIVIHDIVQKYNVSLNDMDMIYSIIHNELFIILNSSTNKNLQTYRVIFSNN